MSAFGIGFFFFYIEGAPTRRPPRGKGIITLNKIPGETDAKAKDNEELVQKAVNVKQWCEVGPVVDSAGTPQVLPVGALKIVAIKHRTFQKQ